jgi:hypothetical protein
MAAQPAKMMNPYIWKRKHITGPESGFEKEQFSFTLPYIPQF